MRTVKKLGLSALLLTMMLVAVACSNSNTSEEEGAQADPEQEAGIPITHITSWYAQPEQGGQFAALMQGFYEEEGLDVTIQPGGPGVNPVQLLAAGEAQFGMGQSDVVINARDAGIPVVAVAGIFQKSPIGLIYHEGQEISGFSDLNGRTIYVPATSIYWSMIVEKYGLDQAQVMQYEDALVGFRSDETAVTHGYVTNAPNLLASQGVKTDYLLVHDSGYQPYATTIYTTEKMIEEQPEVVRAFVEATVRGWEYYLENYEEVNPYILTYNPDMVAEEMNYTAEVSKQLIVTDEAVEHGIGYMVAERWEVMRDLLHETEVITKLEEASNMFTNEFLPQQ